MQTEMGQDENAVASLFGGDAESGEVFEGESGEGDQVAGEISAGDVNRGPELDDERVLQG